MSRLIVPTPDGSSVLVGDPQLFSMIVKLGYLLDELSQPRGELLIAEFHAILDAEVALAGGQWTAGEPPCR